jgi:hypothetical protein
MKTHAPCRHGGALRRWPTHRPSLAGGREGQAGVPARADGIGPVPARSPMQWTCDASKPDGACIQCEGVTIAAGFARAMRRQDEIERGELCATQRSPFPSMQPCAASAQATTAGTTHASHEEYGVECVRIHPCPSRHGMHAIAAQQHIFSHVYVCRFAHPASKPFNNPRADRAAWIACTIRASASRRCRREGDERQREPSSDPSAAFGSSRERHR